MKHWQNITGSILIVFVLFLIQGCHRTITIEDYYTLYPPDEFYDSYHLICKLAGKNDPLILNVDYIKWSKTMIVLRQSDSNWWVIKAKEETLKCCNNDELIGPLSEKEAKKFLSQMSHPKGEMNKIGK